MRSSHRYNARLLMPSGLSAAEIVRTRWPAIPRILVSGTLGEELAIDSLKGGATDYVLKERLSRLAPAVRRAMAEVSERVERQRLQAQVIEAQKTEVIGQLAAGVAHDFNNILAVIMGFSELMAAELDPDHPVQGHVEEITIATSHVGQEVLLTVSDTGSGMSEYVKAHLFEAFFTTKGEGKGTGLGLTTCATIVQQSGGRIEVVSDVGRGSTFKLYFPALEQSPATVAAATLVPPLPRGNETLLVCGRRALRRAPCASRPAGAGIPGSDRVQWPGWTQRHART